MPRGKKRVRKKAARKVMSRKPAKKFPLDTVLLGALAGFAVGQMRGGKTTVINTNPSE